MKLSHNGLQALKGLGEKLSPFLWRHDLATVTSLDLSKNQLDGIDVKSLAPFHNLLFLYLHANPFCEPATRTSDGDDMETKIRKAGVVLKALAKLAPRLTKLRKLTMHGSGIEETPGYRARVLLSIPWVSTRSNPHH